MKTLSIHRQRPAVATLAGGGLAILAAAFILYQLFHAGPPPGDPIDFGFLWIAGRMWAAGLDPYDHGYAAFSATKFSRPVVEWVWVYPPQWWAIVRPLAALSYDQAVWVWRIISVACVGLAATLFSRVGRRLSPAPSLALLLVSTAVLLSAEEIGGSLYLGQTSLVMLLGIALFVAGIGLDRTMLCGLGLALLMLKPNFGVPVAIMALAAAASRKGLVVAAIITLVGCVPLLLGGLDNMLHIFGEMLRNIRGYGSPAGFNAPQRMTGLPHLFHGMSAILAAILAGLAGLLLVTITVRRHGASLANLTAAMWLNMAAVLSGINALHNYDLAFAVTPLPLLPALRRPAQILLMVGVCLMHSARRVAGRLVHGEDPVLVLQSSIDTAGGLSMLAAAIFTAWFGWKAAVGDAESAAHAN